MERSLESRPEKDLQNDLQNDFRRVWHISAECAPLAKVGGLADVVGALPKYQIGKGVDAGVIMPAYHHILDTYSTSLFSEGEVQFAGEQLRYQVFKVGHESAGPLESEISFPVFLVKAGSHFDEPGIYSKSDGAYPFENNRERFPAFQRCVAHFLSSSGLLPGSVIHIHDHHTGLLPFIFKIHHDEVGCPFVYTIHSAEYQGAFHGDVINDLGLDLSILAPSEYMSYGSYDINSMRVGISMADAVTTVSPSYAKQLLDDPGLSHGLHDAFKRSAGKMIGLLNGIDPEIWSPEKDAYISHPFSKDSLEKKDLNKRELCESLGLRSDQILMVFIGRLKYEKGSQLLLDALHNLREIEGVSFAVLGTGDGYFENEFKRLEENWSQDNSLRSILKFDNSLAHKLYAAGDVLLMPSLVEPCGLNQMYAMRYGTLPLVHAVGGLQDSVDDWDEDQQKGTGFLFDKPDWGLLANKILEVKSLYGSESFEKMRQQAMERDYSWEKAVEGYFQLYNALNGEA